MDSELMQRGQNASSSQFFADARQRADVVVETAQVLEQEFRTRHGRN